MKHIFLIILTTASVLHAMDFSRHLINGRMVLPEVMSDLLELSMPVLQKKVKEQFPGSYGSCDGNPPLPCEETGALYYKSSTFYKVLVRWVGGLNDVSIQSMTLSPIAPNATELDFDVKLLFADLPMNIRLEACVPVFGCTYIFDNRDSCCGKDKTLTLKVKMDCHSEVPFLRNTKIDFVSIEPKLNVKANVFNGFDIHLKDITTTVEEQMIKTAEDFIQGGAIAELTSAIEAFSGDSVYCVTPTS